MRHALVTGGAGFIGSHLVDRLLANGWSVTVIDNFDPFYDPKIKWANIRGHLRHAKYQLVEGDIRDPNILHQRLTEEYDVIVHLAAKAGVRPSIQDPLTYQDVNVRGTHCLLEFSRQRNIRDFVFASSSSVYGVNPSVPWRESDNGLLPISPYASTKISGELLGHVYSHLFDIRFTALRFFTVYGPRQRPDLAIHKFAKLMLEGKSIPLYGDGSTLRDYTYVQDIVSGIFAAMEYRGSRFEVINLGNNETISLRGLVDALQEVMDIRASVHTLPEQPGDVPQTWADLSKAKELLNYCPSTALRDGLHYFVDWLRTVRQPGE